MNSPINLFSSHAHSTVRSNASKTGLQRAHFLLILIFVSQIGLVVSLAFAAAPAPGGGGTGGVYPIPGLAPAVRQLNTGGGPGGG